MCSSKLDHRRLEITLPAQISLDSCCNCRMFEFDVNKIKACIHSSSTVQVAASGVTLMGYFLHETVIQSGTSNVYLKSGWHVCFQFCTTSVHSKAV